MTNTRWKVGLGLTLLSLTACGGDEDALAKAEASLDLVTCYGEEIVCDPAAVASEELSLPALRSCDGELGGPLERELMAELPDLDTCNADASSCTTSNRLSGYAFGADNVSWWVFSGSQALVSRHDADGKLLGTTDLAALVSRQPDEIFYSGEIQLDERGHAFVALHTGYEVDEHTRAWLIELDPHGQPVREPTRLGAIGFPLVASAPDGVVITGNLAGEQQLAALAKLDRSAARVWSQTDVRSAGRTRTQLGITALRTDATGHTSVVGQREARDEGTSWGLMRFDPAGNVLWDRVLELPLHARVGSAELSAGLAGDVVISTASDVSGPRGVESYTQLLAHVRSDGNADWAYRFEGVSVISIATHPETGDVYASVQGSGDASSAERFLAVISADGERCRRYAVTPSLALDFFPQSIEHLAVDSEGRVYGTALKTRDRYPGLGKIDPALGRWRLPAE